jgi:hypothetical protein
MTRPLLRLARRGQRRAPLPEPTMINLTTITGIMPNSGCCAPHTYSLACMSLTAAAIVNSVVPFGSRAALNADYSLPAS